MNPILFSGIKVDLQLVIQKRQQCCIVYNIQLEHRLYNSAKASNSVYVWQGFRKFFVFDMQNSKNKYKRTSTNTHDVEVDMYCDLW